MDSAWPFLIGRSQLAGHRVIVAPGYMKTSQEARQLGKLARGETGPGEAFIEELPQGPGGNPATAIFRVFLATRADYFGSGEEMLADRSGREIRVTEGIVVPVPQADAEQLEVTAAVLQAAHREVTPAFLQFWRENDDYQLQYSSPVTVHGQGAPATALILRPAELEPSASRSPVSPAARSIQGTWHHASGSPVEPMKRAQVIAITAVAAAIACAAVLGVFAIVSSGSAPRPSPSSGSSASASPSKSGAPTLMPTSSCSYHASPPSPGSIRGHSKPPPPKQPATSASSGTPATAAAAASTATASVSPTSTRCSSPQSPVASRKTGRG
jgi:hypothetical protein